MPVDRQVFVIFQRVLHLDHKLVSGSSLNRRAWKLPCQVSIYLALRQFYHNRTVLAARCELTIDQVDLLCDAVWCTLTERDVPLQSNGPGITKDMLLRMQHGCETVLLFC